MKIELNRDWSEFLRLLVSHRVRFLLVGGHAVAGHGEPRLTEDLDVFVEPTLENAAKLRAALVEFGFGDTAPSVEALAEQGKIFMLGRKPWRIDMLTAIDGVTFEEAWADKVEAAFENGPLYVIGRASLIKNKRASGRAKDLADIESLERTPAPKPVRKTRASARNVKVARPRKRPK